MTETFHPQPELGLTDAAAASGGAWLDAVARMAAGIRSRVLEHTIANHGGYLSQACSSAEILSTLYLRVMRLGPAAAPRVPPPFPGVPGAGNAAYFTGGAYHGAPAPDLDRFFLSPAHYALILYVALVETGRMAPEALAQFNQDGGTVEMIGAEHSPGFEMMGGSLAQTLSQAAGIALARKRRGDSGRVWVFLSDGEFQEGQTWETIQTLSHYRLDNIGVYVDLNGQQCDGRTSEVMSLDPLERRIEAFGGRALVVDGHDPAALEAPARLQPDGRPLFVLCATDPCRGVEVLRPRWPKLHYVRFVSPGEREAYRKYHASLASSPASQE
jgi:transketolase